MARRIDSYADAVAQNIRGVVPPRQRADALALALDMLTAAQHGVDREFQGPHLLPARDNWQEVADYALDWAGEHAVQSRA